MGVLAAVGIGAGAGARFHLPFVAERRPEAVEFASLKIYTRAPTALVDERYLSFAIDSAQVVGGTFWAPPGKGEGWLDTHAIDGFDFSRPRLRRLAAGLGPAYLRIGGTDADRIVYAVGTAGKIPARGQQDEWVLTEERWDAVNAFARDVDLKIMFTLNAGPSSRDQEGAWDPASAEGLLAYTTLRGYPVEVWELGNEPNAYPLMHRMWLSPRQYAEDLRRARALLARFEPEARLAGPASAFWPVFGEWRTFSASALAHAGEIVDVVTWHYYPQQSHRCPIATRRAEAGRMLGPRGLADVERWASRVEKTARNAVPEAEVWLGETGSAQCGGEPGFSDAFADALWWLDELGRVARRGQKVIVRQTLAGSDYGLLDDGDLSPNPSYWASWLWRGLMGRRVLAVETPTGGTSLGLYAHCTPGGAPAFAPGAVTVLAINSAPVGGTRLDLGAELGAGLAYPLEAPELTARTATLAGLPLVLGPGDRLPDLEAWPRRAATRAVEIPAESAVFLVFADAKAPACL